MKDRYLQALNELERQSFNSLQAYSNPLTGRLNELAMAMINEKMTDNDYIKCCEVYYLDYQKKNNEKGMMFSLLRMEQLLYMKTSRRNRKAFPKLRFTPGIDAQTRYFLRGKKNVYKKTLNEFKKKCATASVIVTIVLMILLVLILQTSFLFGWILSLLVGGAMYLGGLFYLFDRLFDQRIQSLLFKLDPVHRKLDKSLREN